MKLTDYPKHAPMIIFITILVLSIIIISPYFKALLTALVLAFAFYPLYKKLKNLIKSKTASAFFISLLILFLVLFISFFVFNILSKEAVSAYNQAKTFSLNSFKCEDNVNVVCEFVHYLQSTAGSKTFNTYFLEAVKKSTSSLIQVVSNFIITIPKMIINIFLIFFTTFFLLKDSDKIKKKVQLIIPMKKKYQEKIFKQVNDTVYAILYGNLVVAFIQGAIAALGFFIFGVSNPFLWGLLTVIFAFIPFVGTAAVWFPISIVKITNGFLINSNSEIFMGAGILIYGALLISTIDNLLKPKIIGDKSKIHPVVIFIGLLGGLSVIGPIGIIIGPIVLGLLITLFEIYEQERKAIGYFK